MTVSTTSSRISYNGNGVTTVFSFPYRFLANGDIVVVSVSAAGVETTKALTTDYTLTGAGDDAGGSVTMLVAPANGTRLIIYRDTDIVQETDYISGDPFPAETHERALDRLTMIAQEISPNVDRAIKVPVGDSSSLSTTLPAAADRLDKFLVFDAATGATELSTVTQTEVASAVAAAYAAGSTADAVTFLPAGVGAVARSVQSRLRDVVSVTDFGAVGDGVANDKAAIAAAIATGKAVVFPEGTYYLGQYDSSNDVGIDCSDRTVHFTNIGKVKFTIHTATGIGDCYPTVFRLYNSPNSTFGDFYFEDLNADLSTTNRRGLKPYRMTADGVTGTWGDVSIGRIYCHNTIDAVAFDGADAVNRVRNITIQEIHLDNCYYGVNAQNQGDNVFVGVIYANQVRRVYFPYGVTNHRATIYDKNHLGSTATVYIQRGVGGFDTKDIYINYSCYETSQIQTIVRISHLDLLGGTIKNINLNLDVDVPVSSRPLYFVNFDGAGNETDAPSLNVVDEVYVTGRFGATAQNVDTYASYLTNTGKVSLAVEGAIAASATTAVKFIVRDTPITYTPVWSTSGTAPSLGDGTLTGRYEIVGDICNFFIVFTAGSTTTFGTGAFEFTLPKPAAYDQVVSIWGESSGVANYIGLGLFSGTPSRSTVYGVSNASGAAWAVASPFAWGSGDRIRISGSYIVQ